MIEKGFKPVVLLFKNCCHGSGNSYHNYLLLLAPPSWIFPISRSLQNHTASSIYIYRSIISAYTYYAKAACKKVTKSEQAVESGHVLKFVYDSFVCHAHVKWNAGDLGPFLHYEGWIGPRGTAWANEVKFLWNFPQSSIDSATFYSESSALLLYHGGLHTMPMSKELCNPCSRIKAIH